MEPQRVEAQAIFWVEVPPAPVREFLHRLERVLVAACLALVNEQPRGRLRLAGTQVRGLQQRPQHALRRDGMLADELPVALDHTAEVLRPRPVRRHRHDDVTDLPGAQFLRLGGEDDEDVDLPLYEWLHVRVGWVHDPLDVAGWIQSDVGDHGGEKEVGGRAQPPHSNPLALKLPDRTERLSGDDLHATDVDTGQYDARMGRVERDGKWRGEVQAEIRLARGELPRTVNAGDGGNVAHLAEAFGPEQCLGHGHGSRTDTWELKEGDPGRLGRWLRGNWPGVQACESYRPCECHPTQEPPSGELSSVLDTHT